MIVTGPRCKNCFVTLVCDTLLPQADRQVRDCVREDLAAALEVDKGRLQIRSVVPGDVVPPFRAPWPPLKSPLKPPCLRF